MCVWYECVCGVCVCVSVSVSECVCVCKCEFVFCVCVVLLLMILVRSQTKNMLGGKTDKSTWEFVLCAIYRYIAMLWTARLLVLIL